MDQNNSVFAKWTVYFEFCFKLLQLIKTFREAFFFKSHLFLYLVLLFQQPVEAYISAVFIVAIPGGQHVN